MRSLLLFPKHARRLLYPLFPALTSTRVPLPSCPIPIRRLHDAPTPTPEPPFSSRILHSDPTTNPNPESDPEDHHPMNEFLSRFVHEIRGKLKTHFPDITRQLLDEMLVVICNKVIYHLDPATATDNVGPDIELSDDLWKTILEVSASVRDTMRRDCIRAELRKYLHCDEVKQMCRFAVDVGVRGPMLREFRFKWAREKLEEVEFYRGLQEMYEQGKMRDEDEKEDEEKLETKKLEKLPERKSRIKYKIYGLDLSDPEWAKVSQKAAEAEKKFVPEELKVLGKNCAMVEERLLRLDVRKDDPIPVMEEWKKELKPSRVDWLALLERIKERNEKLYFKLAEILLGEESFETNIRDYSKLIDLHSKANRIGDAERILQKMTDKGIVPDVLTKITLLHMYCKTGNLEQVMTTYDSLKKAGYKPDESVYTSMIMACIKAGEPKQGEILTREMETLEIKASEKIYMSLLRAFAELGQVDGANRISNIMHFSGIQQTMESSTLLVEAYSKAKDPEQTRAQFDNMKKLGHMPDDRCTAAMMTAYMNRNFLDKALDLLLTLEKDGFKPGIRTNTVLTDWMCRLQLAEEAERLVSKIREAGDLPFEVHVSLCRMYAIMRQKEKMQKSLKILEARKKLLKADQFERIIGGLIEGGFVEDANRIFSLMQSQGFSSEGIKKALDAAQSNRLSTRKGSRA